MTTIKEGSASAGPSGRSRRKAAEGELNGKPKIITVRGQKLKLPPTVKFRLLQDMLKIRNGEDTLDPLVASLERVLGDEMEKLWEIDVKPTKEDGGLQGALLKLLDEAYDKTFSAYGVTPGE